MNCGRGELCHCFFWWEICPWVQHQFVDLDVAREAAAAYYSVTPANLWSRQDSLDSFLFEDHFHIGVAPADHIRRISFIIPRREDWFSASDPERLAIVCEYCKPLLKLRLKRGFQLDITWSLPEVVEGENLGVLRPIVDTLRGEGVIVTLRGRPYLIRDYRDISDFFDMPLDEWRTKWRIIAQDDNERRQA
jgi:hypothetical protein